MSARLNRVSLKFEPRDVWIGVFWDRTWTWGCGEGINVYLCLVPMLPIIFEFTRCRMEASQP